MKHSGAMSAFLFCRQRNLNPAGSVRPVHFLGKVFAEKSPLASGGIPPSESREPKNACRVFLLSTPFVSISLIKSCVLFINFC